MEIGTEITKVFGQEMAKLYADKVSEEELLKEAEKAWARLRARPSDGWTSSKSELEKLINAEFFARLKTAVQTILDSENNDQAIRVEAESIVESIRAETKKKIVEKVSDQLSELYGTGLVQHLDYIAGSISHIGR